MDSDRDTSPPSDSATSRDEAGSGSGRVVSGAYNMFAGYRAPRFESRWGPWNFCGNLSPPEQSASSPGKTCQSPDGGERSSFETAVEDEDDEEEEDDEDYEDDEDEDDDDDDDDDDDGDDDEDPEEQVEDEGKKELLCSPPNAADGSVKPAFRVGVGLSNLGNTCFLNAVLQCLVYTYPLQQGLSMMEHSILCFLDDFCLICQLKMLMQRLFTQSDEIAPHRIVANLKYFSPDFVRFHQEDAHEFLQCILNKLESIPTGSSNPFSGTPSDNLVKQVFGGRLVSRLRCSKCNHISSMPEDLIDFSLEIDEVDTLEGALDSFTKSEKIEDMRLICERCNEITSMEKQFLVDKAPRVASFHLKRFKNDGTTVEKIRKRVNYPLTLNLHPYTVGHPKHNAGLTYNLYAVIVHLGYSANRGHYFCFVRSSSSVWHEFDDSTVTRVSESHVLSQEAYVLFYAKHEASWFFNGNEVQTVCPPVISPSSVLDNCNQSGESDLSTESLHKCDVQVNRHEEDNVATCHTAFCGPQHVNSVLVEKVGHGKVLLPIDEGDDKNEASMDDSSSNFDMLLNAEEKENRSCFVDTKDESINTSKEVADKSRTLISCDAQPNISACQEHVDFTQAQICPTSISVGVDCSALPSLGEASNLTNQNPISPGGDPTSPPSSLGYSTSFKEYTEVEERILRKRPAKNPPEDQRKRQVVKILKRTNMHMPATRASRFLACSNVTHTKRIRKVLYSNKRNKKGLVSPAKKSDSCC